MYLYSSAGNWKGESPPPPKKKYPCFPSPASTVTMSEYISNAPSTAGRMPATPTVACPLPNRVTAILNLPSSECTEGHDRHQASFLSYVSRSGRNGTLAPKRHFKIRAFKGIGPSLIVPCCYRDSIDHSIEAKAWKPLQDSCQV